MIDFNKTYGRLIPLRRVPGGKVECVCSCGNTTIIKVYSLTGGNTKSCGCLHRERFGKANITHGASETPTFKSWMGMKHRCKTITEAHKRKAYHDQGISVCERWYKFENFLEDMGEKPDGFTLDRIDPTLGYSPDNCRWTTMYIQHQNKRRTTWIEYKGESHTIPEWASIVGITYTGLRWRLKQGWSIKDAIETPGRFTQDILLPTHKDGL